MCFAKAKMLEPEQRLELSTRKRDPPPMQGFKNKIEIDLPQKFLDSKAAFNDKIAAISAKPLDYRQLQFVEFIEFLCRVASCTFVYTREFTDKCKV